MTRLIALTQNAWQWVFLGWVGTLLVGSQVMKLIMAGIQLIDGDHERHSFLGRQLRGLILIAVSVIVAMIVLALIYRVARPAATTWGSVLPGAAAATILWWGINLLLGLYVRNMRYGIVYSGMAAAIGLMVWMEFSSLPPTFHPELPDDPPSRCRRESPPVPTSHIRCRICCGTRS